MSNAQISKFYALSAIMIYSVKKQVSVDAIEKVFKALNVKEFNPKLASLFVFSPSRYEELLTSVTMMGAPNTDSSNVNVSDKNEEAGKVEEEEDDNMEEYEFEF